MPRAFGLQQGPATPNTESTAGLTLCAAKLRDVGNVAKPEDVPAQAGATSTLQARPANNGEPMDALASTIVIVLLVGWVAVLIYFGLGLARRFSRWLGPHGEPFNNRKEGYMARRKLEVEATCVLAERDDGWHIRLQFDGGEWFQSEESFPSREAAETAFYKWRSEVGAEILTAQ
jgi:hypothetical protein